MTGGDTHGFTSVVPDTYHPSVLVIRSTHPRVVVVTAESSLHNRRYPVHERFEHLRGRSLLPPCPTLRPDDRRNSRKRNRYNRTTPPPPPSHVSVTVVTVSPNVNMYTRQSLPLHSRWDRVYTTVSLHSPPTTIHGRRFVVPFPTPPSSHDYPTTRNQTRRDDLERLSVCVRWSVSSILSPGVFRGVDP